MPSRAPRSNVSASTPSDRRAAPLGKAATMLLEQAPGTVETMPRAYRPWQRAAAFVLAAFLLSWVPWLALVASGRDPFSGPGATALWVAGGSGPPLAAVVVAGLCDGRRGLRRLWAGVRRWRLGRWYLVLLIPLAVALATVAFMVATGQAMVEVAGRSFWLMLPVSLLMGLAFGGLEEVGWRGVLLPLLQDRVTALAASVGIGLLWALWHAPLFLMDGTSQASMPVVWFTLQGVGLAVVFTWAYNGTRGGLLLAVLLHAAVNGWNGVVFGGVAPDAAGDAVRPTAVLFLLVAGTLVLRHGGRHLAARPRTGWATEPRR